MTWWTCESVVERAAFHGAFPVTMQDVTSQLPAHGPGTATQIQRFAVLGAADQVDIPVAQDLLEGSRSQTWSSEDTDPLLPIGFGSRPGVEDHRHIDR